MNKILKRIYQNYKSQPKNKVIVDKNGSWTWEVFFDYSYAIAYKLKKQNIKSSDRVSIELPNIKEFIASIIACQILGAVYVPLGDKNPKERAEYIRRDCNVKVVIDGEFLSALDISCNSAITPVDKKDNELEMIIYTSGSTGNPKGVMHSVENWFSSIKDVCCSIEVNSCKGDRWATIAPLNFILGLQNSFLSICAKQKNVVLYLVPGMLLSNPQSFLQYFIDNKINKAALNDDLAKLFKLKKTYIERLFIGGNITRNCYIDGIQMYNCYGSTELCAASTFYLINSNTEITPVGKCHSRFSAYIVDDNNKEADEGELCFTGEVALGYLNQSEDTKKAFIANPFYKIDGNKRMFRTGDIARKDEGGNIVVLGRKDFMVKINGRRVELEEIEYVLRNVKGIKDAAVKYFNKNNQNYLVAYYCADKLLDEKYIVKELEASLTSYMIPGFYVKLNKLPLFDNGKVNRLELPEFEPKNFISTYVPPTNNIEKDICAAYSKIFNIKKIGINDDFIVLGGDSLAAMNLISILEDYTITSTDILKLKTPYLIAQNLKNKQNELSELKLDKYNLSTGAPLSEQQLNIYLDIVMNKKQESYLIPLEVKLDKYSTTAVINALNKLINIHPILKSYIESNNDVPFLKIGKRPSVSVVDKTNNDDLQKFLTKSFDINKELSRFLFNKKTKVLYGVFHHLIFDGLSTVVFSNHIIDVLKNNYIKKDLKFLQSSAFSSEIKNTKLYKDAELFYDMEFADSENIAEPIADIGDNKPGHNTIKLKVDQDKLNSFIKKHEITKNILFTSVFAYTLSRFTNNSKSFFSILDHGRDKLTALNSVGMFVNTLPVLIDCSDNTIDNFLIAAQDVIFKTIEYSFFPLRELKRKYNITSNVQFQYFPDLSVPDEEIYEEEQRKDLICDLSCDLYEKNNTYLFQITNSNKYSLDFVNKFLLTYEKILNEVLIKKSLKEINYNLTKDLKAIKKINNTEAKLKYNDIAEAFNESLKLYPNNVLVRFSDFHYTYKEASKWINNLAKILNKIPEKSNIAIFTHRSHYYVLCALGVLNIGCAYVPIDDTYPDDRIKFMLEDSETAVILVSNETADRVKEISKIRTINVDDIVSGGQSKCLLHKFDSDYPAVILYTSGTTGLPKGTILPRRAINSFCNWCCDMTKFSGEDVFALYCSFGFDVHTEAIFTPLFSSGKVVIVPNQIRTDLIKLVDFFEKEKVTHVELSTAFTKLLLSYRLPNTLKVLLTGGEALGDFQTKVDCLFYDTYGPTEATVSVSYIKIEDKIDPCSIGYLTSNTKAYILDRERRPVPFGGVGELYLSGYQLATGYLNRDKENKEAFYTNPFDGNEYGFERMYKTGDIVRFLKDGTLGFIGRVDSQVKIRGNRVELVEVEATIREIDEVKDVTVQVVDNNHNKELVAYIVTTDKAIKGKLKQYVSARKPDYMIPSHVVILDKVPLNVNGKVDRRALPKIDLNRSKATYVAPSNKVENVICDAFSQVFNMKKVGINDDFNLLGGDSIKAIRLVSILNNKHLSIEASQILDLRTPKAISSAIRQKEVKIYKSIEGKISLSPIQKYFFEQIKEKNTYNQIYVVEANRPLDISRLQDAFNKLTNIHDELRASFDNDKQVIRPVNIVVNKIKQISIKKNIKKAIICELEQSIQSLNLKNNHLVDVKLINDTYLTFVIHHLIIDGVSWSVLLDDLTLLYDDKEVMHPYTYANFVKDVKKYSKSITTDIINKYKSINDLVNEKEIRGRSFNVSYSFKSLYDANNSYELSENDYLLLAVSRAYKKTYNRDVIFEMESYGRDERIADVNQTVGWFTAIYPMLVEVSGNNSRLDIINDLYNVKRAKLDNKHLGIDYLIACYYLKKLKFKHSPVTFNYLSDEFSYNNSLFKSVPLDNKKAVNKSNDDISQIIYGISLDIVNNNGIYSLAVSCPSDTYLSNKYQSFLNAIEEEALLISKILKEKTYVYKLYNEPLGVYLDEKVNNKNTAYSCFDCIKFKKGLNVEDVKKRINKLLQYHPVLKTRLVELNGIPFGITDGTPSIEVINKNIDDVSLSVLVKPFNFDETLARFYIINDKDNVYLAYDMHHMISDASSQMIINDKLLNGVSPELDFGFLKKLNQELKNQYSNDLSKAKLFYEKEFIDDDNIIEPIADINNSYGGFASIYLGNIKDEILFLANRLSITPSNILTSAFAYTLSRFISTDNTYFTFTNHGRDLEGLENSIGMYVKTIPVILNTSNQRVDSYLKESSKHILEAMKYSIYPFRLLASQYHLNQNISFEYNLNLNDIAGVADSIQYKQDKEANMSHVSHLLGVINDYQNGYVFSVEHSFKYSKDTVIRFLKTYQKILEGFFTKSYLKDINYTLALDQKVFDKINSTETNLKYRDIIEAYNNSVIKYPNNIIVSFLDNKYTYQESNIWINSLLKKLNKYSQGSNIAILTHRSHFYLLAALAIIARGSAYVPIDDSYPNDRIKFMLDDSNAKCVLVTNETYERAKKLTNKNIIKIDNIKCSETLNILNTNFDEKSPAIILYTSGTTGISKGTIIPRKAVLNFAQWDSQKSKISQKDVVALYSSYSFDVHMEAIYPTIFVGGTIDITPSEARLDPKEFIKYIKNNNISHMDIPTAITKSILNYDFSKNLKSIFTGGELLGDIGDDKSNLVYDVYGPTEVTVTSSIIKAKDKIHYSSVGHILPNIKAYILDNEHRQVPVGGLGELYLSGYQLAKGYLNREKENKEAFFDNPFDGDKLGYERMYKTGDVVRYLPDYTLGFIGRNDSQVKIRGNRVELDEVEVCIKEIKEIKDVTVQTILNNSNKELVAYVVSSDDNIKEKVVNYVTTHKPAYMAPSHVVVLDKIPLNINGKVDKRALPDVDINSNKVEYIAPSNKFEKMICNAFSKVFNLKNVGINDDFLVLGGDSLSAIYLLSILKEYPITVADITNLKTPKLIAKKILADQVLDLNLNQYTLSCGAPLSEQQLNIYLDIIMNKKVESYLIPFEMKLDKYSFNDITEALDTIIEVHPILKAYIDSKSDVPFIKLGKKPSVGVVEHISQEELTKYLTTSFDINQGLSRFLINQENNTLYAVFHHLIFDGLSTLVFTQHLLDILNKKEIKVDVAFLKASSFSNEIKKTELYKEAELFYEQEFGDSLNIIEPISDIGNNKPSFQSLNLDVNQNKINIFIKKHKITKNVLFTSVFAYTLSRFTNSLNSYFAMIENGRDRLNASESVGMFVNTLPILIDCSNDSIKNFISKNQEKIYQTINYNFYPFRLLNSKYNLSSNIVFQYQPNLLSDNINIKENASNYEDYLQNRTDLISDLSFTAEDNCISVTSSKKYSPKTVKKMLLVYERVLNEILIKNNLKDIRYTLKQDLDLINKINATENKLKYHDILEAFNDSLKKYPSNILVSYLDTRFTYDKGTKWINNLSKKLNNISQGSNIAILTHRSHYYLLTALGVLAHGCAYVPIDDTYPDERIKFMLKDADAKAVLVTNETFSRVKKLTNIAVINVSEIKANGALKPLKIIAKEDDTAVILYTSGTTGTPKGTEISRLALLNLSSNCIKYSNMTKHSVSSLYSVFTFDMHVTSFYPHLFVGAELNIIPDKMRLDINKLIDHLNYSKTTHMTLPTKVATILLDTKHSLPLCSLLVGGEKLPSVTIPRSLDMFDGYGPTESLAFISCINVKDKQDLSSVGYLVDNIKAYILDKEHRLVSYGAMGELYLSGYQLAKGYLNRNKENALAFFDNPFDGDKHGYEKMYKTGDVVRYLPDGTLGFVGRADSQVKIRGNRVELGEVESVIREIKEVDNVTVQTSLNNNNKELVAYVVSNNKNIKEKIIKYVGDNKPSFMIPSHVVVMDKIPLNANGKVDKRALPKVDIKQNKVKYVAPSNKIEKVLCETFAKIFNLEKVGIDDDFLKLGGDSLQAIRLINLLEKYQISASDITNFKTPRMIAHKINGNKKYDFYLDKYTLETGAPLSEQQLNIYLDVIINKKNESYKIPLSLNLCDYSNSKIQFALKEIFNIHPILKSCVQINKNTPWIKIKNKSCVNTVAKCSNKDRSIFINKSFDIHEELSRFMFVEEDKTLYVVFHHLIFDGMSFLVFIKHFFDILEGKMLKQDTTFLKLCSFSERIKNTEAYKEAESFFEKEFTDYEKNAELLPDVGTNKPGYSSLKLKTNQSKINSFINELGITRNILFTSVFAYSLSRYIHSDHPYFTIVNNGRDHLDAKDSVGMFVNVLPITINCKNNTVRDFIKLAKEKIYKTLNYNFYPFRILNKKYNIQNNIEFQYQPSGLHSNYDDKLTTKNFEKEITERKDFISDLSFVVTDETISVTSSSKNSLTSKKLIEVFNNVLSEIIEKKYLKDINFTDNKDLKLLNKLNDTSCKLKFDNLLTPIENQAKISPSNTFVKFKDVSYNYKQSISIIKNISCCIKDKIAQYNGVVAIYVERSHNFVFSSIAVLNNNCIVMPIEDAYPNSRIEYMISDSGADFIVVSDTTENRVKNIIKESDKLQNVNLINIDKIENIDKQNDTKFMKVNLNSPAYIFYTSGSTGVPKPVVQTHLGLLNMALWQIDLLNITNNDTYALYPSFGFDSHLQTIFSTLCSGACVDVVPEEIRLNMTRLNEYFVKHNITLLKITTQVGKLWLSSIENTSIRAAYLSGEKLGRIPKLKNVRIIDGYGPTENTLQTSCIDYDKKIHISSVGKQNKNIKVYILDKELRRVPYGAVGELYLSGFQLSQGYLNRKKETNAAFLKNPFDGNNLHYERMYKTGDIVRYLPDGTIGFVGRADSQVKIRGNRVELAEVESCLRQIDFIKDVTVRDTSFESNKELVAYIVLNKKVKDFKQLIVKHVTENKPNYMIPGYIIELKKIPLNANGKVDSKALPKPNLQKLQNEYVAPTNKTEKIICEAFKKAFELKQIGINDDFLSLGGDSLTAIRILYYLKDYQLSAADITTNRTPKEIAKKLLTDNRVDININKYKINEGCPFSENQLNIYLDIVVNKKIESYLIPLILDLSEFSLVQIKTSFKKLVEVHPILKGYVSMKDKLPWLLLNKNNVDLNVVENVNEEKLKTFLALPFNIEEKLCRFMLASSNKKFFAVFHHLIFDGLSIFVFINDFKRLLHNESIKDIDDAFVKNTIYHEEIKKTKMFNEAEDFYEKHFCDESNIVEPIEDVGKNEPSYNEISIDCDPQKIELFLSKYKITRGVFYTIVFAYTLSRFTYSEKSYFTFIENGRERLNINNAIGMFVNTLPLVIDCHNVKLDEFILNAKNTIYETMRYNFYPFRLLKKKYNINNNISFQYRPDNFDDSINQNENGILFDEGIKNRRDLISDLVFTATNSNISVTTSNKYSSNTALKILQTYKKVLNEILVCDELQQIDYTLEEDIKVINKINATKKQLKYNDVLEAFNESLKKYPNNILVGYLDTKYTYNEAAIWINNLTKRLEGVKKGSNIAILTHRSHYYLLCALTVLNCGCAYVPIDDSFPQSRIDFMIKDSNAKAVLVTNETKNHVDKKNTVVNVGEISFSGATKNLNVTFDKNDNAIILYTSGTTGIPKGTVITRKAILNVASWYADYTKMTQNDIYSLYTVCSFDMHVLAYYPHLFVGASLDVVPNEIRLNMKKLNDYFSSRNITHTFLTTNVGKMFASSVYKHNIKNILVAGEKLGEFIPPKEIQLFDGYGPTESLAIITYINSNKRIHFSSVGKLGWNIKVYILDKEQRQVPFGAIGELYISGYQLAKGYLNRSEENEEAFFDNPFDGKKLGYERMYKTGDVVRYLPDGTIGFVGRVDSQVKIRGNRVELGEVESVIREIKEVNDVTVQVSVNNNNKELVAYVESEKDNIKNIVQDYIRNKKPEFMVPSHVVVIDKIPLNANGKVDKRALPKVDIKQNKVKHVAPRNNIEKVVCDAFGQVFNLDKVSINDDFISLGGDSLIAIRIISILTKYQVTASDITNLRTPKLLAKKIINQETLNLDLQKYTLESGVPLSEQQLNIYLDIIVKQKRQSYYIPLVIDLSKYPTSNILLALDKTLDAHPVLSCCIVSKQDHPYMIVGKKPKVDILKKEDLCKKEELLFKGFDISEELAHFYFDQTNKLLYCVFHHLIFDGASMMVFENHLIESLNNKKLNVDFAFLKASAFSDEIKKTKAYSEAEDFFENEFKDQQNIIEPIYDVNENEPCEQTLKLHIDQDKISKFIKENKITKSILFTSVFAYMISRFTNSENSCFTFIENGRDRFNAVDSIGMFVNTLPVLIDCSNDSVSNFIKKSKEIIYQTINYNFYPFRLLKNKYDVTANISFQYQPYVSANAKTYESGLLSRENIAKRKDFISELSFSATDDSISVMSSNKYSSKTIKRMILIYEKILNEILIKNKLEDFNYSLDIDVKEIKKINKTETELTQKDILEVFNETALKFPNNTLVSYKNKKYTYKQSMQWINNLVDKLKDIPKGSSIAIFVHRSHYYLLTALSILTHNCVYVPIDDTYPDERIKFILKDCDAKAILVSDKTINRISGLRNISVVNVSDIDTNGVSKKINIEHDFNDTAIILYTSGTTGLPKGSLITRKAILNISKWYAQKAKILNNDVFAMYTSCSFDMHVIGYFAILINGAALDIVPYEIRLDMKKLNDYFSSRNITHTFLTTNVGKMFASSVYKHNIKNILVAGEKLGEFNPPKEIELFDGYGPTESLAIITYINSNKRIHFSSVGKLGWNIKVYILDKEQRQVPFGAIGELYISGYQLAKGYLNRSGENEEAFFDNPFDGKKLGYERMYKTGDVVRYLPDGTIGFIGRADSQVKIRGNRVELSEVETVIREIKEIKAVTVQTIINTNNKELVAYVVSEADNIKNIVQDYIRCKKPEFMIPSYVVEIDKIPLNANGKVDKKLLPVVGINQNESEYVSPRNEVEKNIQLAVNKVLGVNAGITSSLLDFGMHSLDIINLISRFSEYGYDIDISSMIKNPTIQSWAENISTRQTNKYKYQKLYHATNIMHAVYRDIKRRNEGNKPFIYNTPFCLVLKDVDVDIIKRNVYKLLDKHLGLKIHMKVIDGDLMFERRDDWYPKISVNKLKDKPNNNYFAKLVKPFDVIKDDLVRFSFHVYKNFTYIFVDIHHILIDDKSLNILEKSIYEISKGLKKNEEVKTIFDLAIEQKKIIESKNSKEDLLYFKQIFEKYTYTKLPTKKVSKNKCGISKEMEATFSLHDIDKLCQQNSITAANLFSACIMLALHNATKSDRIMIQNSFDGRKNISLFNTVAFLALHLPVYYNFHNETRLIELAKTIKNQSLNTYSRLLFYQKAKKLNLDNINEDSVVKVIYIEETKKTDFNDMNFITVNYKRKKIFKYGITVYIEKHKDCYKLIFRYNNDVYYKKDIEDFVKRIRNELIKL